MNSHRSELNTRSGLQEQPRHRRVQSHSSDALRFLRYTKHSSNTVPRVADFGHTDGYL